MRIRSSGKRCGPGTSEFFGPEVGWRVEIQRPRCSQQRWSRAGLAELAGCSSRDLLDEWAFEQMGGGSFHRRYPRSLGPVLPGRLQSGGISKSAVSERFVVGDQRRLTELMRRDLRRAQAGRAAHRRRALR